MALSGFPRFSSLIALTSGTWTDWTKTSSGRRFAKSPMRVSALLASPASANVRAAPYTTSGLRETVRASVASFVASAR